MIVDSPATKSLIAILLPFCLLVQSCLPSNMSSILSVLKTKLGEYMLALPDGAAKYEDYEAWAQGFAKWVVSQSFLSSSAGC